MDVPVDTARTHRRGAHPASARPRTPGWLPRLSRAGLLVGGLWLLASFTPSLLPRPWWLQGVVAAFSGVCGYVVGWLLGVVAHGVTRWLGLRWSVDPRRARLLQQVALAVGVLVVLAVPALTVGWQRSLARYVGNPAPAWWYPYGASVVALLVFALCLLVWAALARLLHLVLGWVRHRVVRAVVARLVAGALTVGIVALALDLVVQPAVMAVVNRSAHVVNSREPEGKQAPTSPLRSGGPGSPYPWDSLGQDGMTFVSSGPDAAAIRRVTGRPATEPIRVFVGVGGSLDEQAAKVVGELDRTHAWDRRAIVLVTPTSTGYTNVWGAASVEYLLDGDTALAGFAYSTLPSAWGLLTAPTEPRDAARALLAAVRARLDAMPADRRPRLYATGESLGALGGDGAYASPDDMLRRVDGAVWSGTPTFAPNRSALTAGRDAGSTSIVPVVDRGRHVRFAGDPTELAADEYGRPLGPWAAPRVVYLQHPSDPVAWWSPSLAFSSPQWLRETRDNTPMAQMSWTPLVTFWQVAADMLVSNEVPGGFGHRYYGTDMVPAWAAVLRDPRTPAQLRPIVDAVGR